MRVKIRTFDHGPIGGFSAAVSLDGGKTWKGVPMRYVGGSLVSFDSKAQAVKYARNFAKREADALKNEVKILL